MQSRADLEFPRWRKLECEFPTSFLAVSHAVTIEGRKLAWGISFKLLLIFGNDCLENDSFPKLWELPVGERRPGEYYVNQLIQIMKAFPTEYYLKVAWIGVILVFPAYLIYSNVRYGGVGSVIFGLVLALVAVSPVFLSSHLVKKFSSQRARCIFLVLSYLSFGLGCIFYYDAFFVHIDALNSLVLLFLPFWQVVGISAAFLFIVVVERKLGKS